MEYWQDHRVLVIKIIWKYLNDESTQPRISFDMHYVGDALKDFLMTIHGIQGWHSSSTKVLNEIFSSEAREAILDCDHWEYWFLSHPMTTSNPRHILGHHPNKLYTQCQLSSRGDIPAAPTNNTRKYFLNLPSSEILTCIIKTRWFYWNNYVNMISIGDFVYS